MACSAFTIGKLFPARYICETRHCSKLVHCSVMTLCSLLFDIMVIWVMYVIKQQGLERLERGDGEEGVVARLLGAKCGKAAKLLLALSKSGGLAVSAVWVLIDLRILIDSAPGQGSLILGSVAAAASLLMLLVEFGLWLLLLPKALKQLGEVAGVHGSGAHFGGDTVGRLEDADHVSMAGLFAWIAG